MIPFPPRALAASSLVVLVGLGSSVRGQVSATEIASLPDLPIGVTAPSGDVHRLFVIQRCGRVRLIRDGALQPAPFLDIAPEVTTYAEGGLLGLAFHPDYGANGRFYVSFIERERGRPHVREYLVSADPDLAEPSSGSELLDSSTFPVLHEHCAGDLQFGPDGMLYFSLGDGGGNPALAQDLSSYSGKLLRIDVDAPAPHVPSDNPYASPTDGALDLIWARGFRNPWRFSFDRRTGDLYIPDVGSDVVGGDNREEIDFQPRSRGMPGAPGYHGGRNYGWPCMEGSRCGSQGACPCDTSGATLTLPNFEWDHVVGSAIIGGFVYRGSAIPSLRGRYVYGDFSANKVWTLVMQDGTPTDVQDRSERLRLSHPGGPRNITSFGEDANGELYFTCYTSPLSGKLFRIDPLPSACEAPVEYCSTSPNSTGYGASMYWSGSASIVRSDLVLIAGQVPRGILGSFRCGTQAIQQPFGNGTNCVGGNVIRLPFQWSDSQGEAALVLDVASISVGPGDTRYFQFLYRDPAGGGTRINLSNGLRVAFCP